MGMADFGIVESVIFLNHALGFKAPLSKLRVNTTTIIYLRSFITQIRSTIILLGVLKPGHGFVRWQGEVLEEDFRILADALGATKYTDSLKDFPQKFVRLGEEFRETN